MSRGTLFAGLGALAGSLLPGVGVGLGLQIGAAFGSVLESSPSQERGKVSDLTFSGSSLDVPIPRVWGSARVGGNVVWMAKNPKTKGYFFERKKTKRVGGSSLGKGAPVTDYTYSASPFFLLAVGTLWFPEEDATLWREPYVAEAYFGTELIYRQDAAGNVTLNKHDAVVLRGTDTQSAPSLIVSSGGRGAQTPAFRGSIGMLFPELNVTPFGNQLPQMWAVVKTAPVTVGDVLSDLARLSGMPVAWIDFSDADMPLTGFAWLERAAPRTAMETLCRAYALDLIETDGKLVARKRYAEKVPFAIPAGWLGAGENQAANARAERADAYERDLPARVSVGFYDSGSLYERSVAEDMRQTGDTARDATFPTGLTLTAPQAREIAARESDEAWAARETIAMPLPFAALILEPGDVVTFDDEGESVTARVETMTCDPLGVVRVAGKRFDPESGTRAPIGGTTGNAVSDPVTASPSAFVAFSGREIAPEHQTSAGIYVAASGDDGWRGGTAWYLPPGATEWLRGPDLVSRAVFGVTSASLAAGTEGDLDTAHSVRVDVSASYGALGSIEDAALTGGENLAWIGDEILAFAVADPVLSGAYDLSRLLRGLQGSESVSHAPGERFVLAEEGGLGRIEVPETHVGLVYSVKVLSPGQTLADVAAKSVTIAARNRTATEVAFDAITRTVTIAPTTISTQTGSFEWKSVSLPSAPNGTRLAFLQVEAKDGGGSGVARVLARDAAGGPETPVASADLDSGQPVNFSSGAWVRVGGTNGAHTVDLRSLVGFDGRQTVSVLAWGVADLVGSVSGVGGSIGRQGETGPVGPAGPGVPSGGAAGQVAAKASGEDYDLEWIDAPSGVEVPGTDRDLLYNDGGALGARSGAKVRTFSPPASSPTNALFAATEAGDVDIAIYPFNYAGGVVKGFRIDSLGAKLTFAVESYGGNPENSAGFQLTPSSFGGAAVFEGWDASEFSIQSGDFPITFKPDRTERLRLTTSMLRWTAGSGSGGYASLSQESFGPFSPNTVGLQMHPPGIDDHAVFEGWDCAGTMLASSRYGDPAPIYLSPGRSHRVRVEAGGTTLLRNGLDAGVLRMEIGQGGKFVGFRAPQSQISSVDLWTLPTTLGAARRALTTLNADGTLGWSRAIPDGGAPFEILMVDPSGSGEIVTRVSDMRMYAVKAANTPLPQSTNTIPANAPNVLGIDIQAGNLPYDGMTFVAEAVYKRRDGTAVVTYAIRFNGTLIYANNMNADGAIGARTFVVTIMRVSSSVARVHYVSNGSGSQDVRYLEITGVNWAASNVLAFAGNHDRAVESGKDTVISSVVSYIRNAGAASLFVGYNADGTPQSPNLM